MAKLLVRNSEGLENEFMGAIRDACYGKLEDNSQTLYASNKGMFDHVISHFNTGLMNYLKDDDQRKKAEETWKKKHKTDQARENEILQLIRHYVNHDFMAFFKEELESRNLTSMIKEYNENPNQYIKNKEIEQDAINHFKNNKACLEQINVQYQGLLANHPQVIRDDITQRFLSSIQADLESRGLTDMIKDYLENPEYYTQQKLWREEMIHRFNENLPWLSEVNIKYTNKLAECMVQDSQIWKKAETQLIDDQIKLNAIDAFVEENYPAAKEEWKQRSCYNYAAYMGNLENAAMISADHLSLLANALGIQLEFYTPTFNGKISMDSPWVLKVYNESLVHWEYENLEKSVLDTKLHNVSYAGELLSIIGLKEGMGPGNLTVLNANIQKAVRNYFLNPPQLQQLEQPQCLTQQQQLYQNQMRQQQVQQQKQNSMKQFDNK